MSHCVGTRARGKQGEREGETGEMRTLRTVLAMGNPTPEEVIDIRKWLEQHPDTEMAGRLAERYPHLTKLDGVYGMGMAARTS